MRPTRISMLALLAALALLSGVASSRLYLLLTSVLMPVRIGTVIAMIGWGLVLLSWTLHVRRRLAHLARARHERQHPGTPFRMDARPLEPLTAARTVAFALASSRAGSLLAGFYFGVALTYLPHLESGDVRWRLGYAAGAVLIAIGIVSTALWLERSCRLPGPPVGGGADAVAS